MSLGGGVAFSPGSGLAGALVLDAPLDFLAFVVGRTVGAHRFGSWLWGENPIVQCTA